MKLPTYKAALQLGKEKLGEMMVPVKVNKARKQAELEMCKLDEQIASKTSDLHEACTQESVNFPHIIDLQDSLGLLERKKRQYQQILDEMFPEEEEAA